MESYDVKRIIRAAHTALRGTDPPLPERLKIATKWLGYIDLSDVNDEQTRTLLVATREDGITDDERVHRITRLYVAVYSNATAPAFDTSAWGSFFWN